MSFNDIHLMKTRPAQNANIQEIDVSGRIAVTRLEIKQGTFTQSHRHESECVVMVLEGALRFHFSNRMITLGPNEMLRLVPGDEADTVDLDLGHGVGIRLHTSTDK